MKVGIVMFYDDQIRDYGDINFEINKRYCEKHNLDIIVSHTKFYMNRNSMWERIPLILNSIKNYDYLVWIDADAFFYYDSKDIREVINAYPNQNFIFSFDIGNNNVNSGFFIVKNSEYCIDFLIKWGFDDTLCYLNKHPHWPDQGVLMYMIEENTLDIINNCVMLDYGILQHFTEDELQTMTPKPYVFHLAGKEGKIRYDTSKKYFETTFKI